MKTDDAMMRAADDNMRPNDDMIAHDDLKTVCHPFVSHSYEKL